MPTQPETQAVEQLLARYAQALQAADSTSLPSFYTNDGVFMPEGTKPFPARSLATTGQRFFNNVGFRITYAVQHVAVDGGYVFVQATAHTTTTQLATGQEVSHISQDFFVLRQEQQAWKIFRYLFHNVQAQYQ